MEEKLLLKANELAAKNYSFTIIRDDTIDGEPIYLAKSIELYGCMAQGASRDEAINNLKEAQIDYIYSLLKDQVKIPEPAPRPAQTLEISLLANTNSRSFVDQVSFPTSKDKIKQINEKKPLYEVVE